MKYRYFVWLVLILSVCMYSTISRADSIPLLNISGTPAGSAFFEGSPGASEPQFYGVSFTLDHPFNNVSISVPKIQLGSPSFIGDAWLTNAVGSSATSANVIATTAIDSTVSFPGLSSTTFFNGLDLGPGTYYFLITSPYCDSTHPCPAGYGLAFWQVYSPFTADAVPGITYNGDITTISPGPCTGGLFNPSIGCGINHAFEPASDWFSFAEPSTAAFSFEISHTVPEPPSIALLLGGLVLFSWIRRNKARTVILR